MEGVNEEVKIYQIKEKTFWESIKNILSIFVFTLFIFVLIFAFTSDNPIKDGLIVTLCFLIFSLIFLFSYIKRVHKIVIKHESVQICGNIFNRPFVTEISHKKLHLTINPLGIYKLIGYEMKFAGNGKYYLINDLNDWKTQNIRKMLQDIKQRRFLLKIYREDGTYFINEIEHFMSKNGIK